MPADLLAALVYFAIGIALRAAGIAKPDHGALVFRLVFFVTLPALAFRAISTATLGPSSALLPVAGFVVDCACALVALTYCRRRELARAQAGAVILSASIMNTAFMFPFILALLGPAALADAVLLDIGNAFFVATVAYSLAMRSRDAGDGSVGRSLFRTVRSPLFVAVVAAVAVNLAATEVPPLLRSILDPLAGMTTPLILVGVALLFSISRLRGRLPLYIVLLRMGTGAVAASLLVVVFGFTGLTAVTVFAIAAAPIGFNSVALASIGRLDAELSSAALSLSVAVGLAAVTAYSLIRWIPV